MKNVPKISDAEWEVMREIWEQPGITANEIVAKFAGRKDWSPHTIRSLANRLVKKGAVGYAVQGKHYCFLPLVSKEECIHKESQSFLDRIFDGELSPLFAHFVKSKQISRKELEELKRILTETEPE
ncbi:MAG: transcriptional regulator [Lentisphaerae bacterium GWF2_52_8]|nr:MAG: transcriptional regulator [Lentisphaerae bacterium GWF2_52_8]